jgi:hypothetical protein
LLLVCFWFAFGLLVFLLGLLLVCLEDHAMVAKDCKTGKPGFRKEKEGSMFTKSTGDTIPNQKLDFY